MLCGFSSVIYNQHGKRKTFWGRTHLKKPHTLKGKTISCVCGSAVTKWRETQMGDRKRGEQTVTMLFCFVPTKELTVVFGLFVLLLLLLLFLIKCPGIAVVLKRGKHKKANGEFLETNISNSHFDSNFKQVTVKSKRKHNNIRVVNAKARLTKPTSCSAVSKRQADVFHMTQSAHHPADSLHFDKGAVRI